MLGVYTRMKTRLMFILHGSGMTFHSVASFQA